MDVAVQLTCPCRPGFIYKSSATLAIHRKSKAHQAWEKIKENKDDKIRSKEFENEAERMRRQLEQRIDVESTLMARIHQLEHECTYWKTQYSLVCPYVN
jgi:hypothetical protein